MTVKDRADRPQDGEMITLAGGLTRRDLMQRASMFGLAAAFGGFGAMPAFAADFDMKK